MSGAPEAATFAPEPASAGAARRFVAAVLERSGAMEAVEPTVLLVSEVVTNAVLHAGTPVTVAVAVEEERVHVDVADGSSTIPSVKGYERDAATGRGRELVRALSSAWGVERRGDGKCVWFEIPIGGDATASGEQGDAVMPAPQDTGPPVRFLSLPVELVWAMAKYGDALLREAVLLALGGDREVGDAADWSSPFINLEPLLVHVREARSNGVAALDVDCSFEPSSGAEALQRLALVNEADRLATEGKLLLPPALPELAACRRWLLGEVIRQHEGDAPQPWVAGPTERVDGVALPEDLRAQLAAMEGGVLGADAANRIVYASDEAAALLGWEAGELVGHRLTTIVPPELRERHLAGYTRFQITAEPVLIGKPVTVPALCRDGSTVEVELLITAIGGARGVFAAKMKAV